MKPNAHRRLWSILGGLPVVCILALPAAHVRAQDVACDWQMTQVTTEPICGDGSGSWTRVEASRCGAPPLSICQPNGCESGTANTCGYSCTGNLCAPPPGPCSPCTGESCNGSDDQGDGQTDEGCGGGDCSNYRTDPVHVGVGAFISEPSPLATFLGSSVPLEFVVRHFSNDGWAVPYTDPAGADQEPTRLAQRWFHTFDEKLFASNGAATLTSPAFPGTAFSVVHRGAATAAGQRFSCPATAGSSRYDFTCTSSDGSLDSLSYQHVGACTVDADCSFGASCLSSSCWGWRLDEGQTRTHFGLTGRLGGRSSYDGLESWRVVYRTTGTYAGRLDYAEDHLLRRLVFIWTTVSSGGSASHEVLDQVRDAAGVVLADFNYDATGHRLTSTTSALGTETYTYESHVAGSSTYLSSFLASVSRDGVAQATLTSERAGTTSPGGRVRTIAALDGTYSFRFAGETGNLCTPNPSRTTMIIDRSSPATPVTCASDAACLAAGHACDAGVCRPYTCQEYFQTAGGAVDFGNPVAITGNCPCSGASTFQYTTSASYPRRVSVRTLRDGSVTTSTYDGYGRLASTCEGDNDTNPANACPAGTAALTTYTYAAFAGVETTLVATVTRRSRFSGTPITTTYTYNGTTRRMTGRAVEGYTYDAAGTAVLETQTTNYGYTGALLTSVIGPALGQRTDYVYYPTGGALESGMIQHERRFWGLLSTNYLQTTYSSYTGLGRPQTIAQLSRTTTLTYSYGGMRTDTRTVGGQLTSYTYSAGGRLTTTVEPSGRRVEITYGSFGRPSSVIYRDVAGATNFDRVLMSYDAAGRRTSVAVQRIVFGTLLDSTAYASTATYEDHGFAASAALGPQSPTQFFYDAAGMGELTQLVRGDGDTVDHSATDAFGRESSVIRHFTGVTAGTHAYTYGNGTTVPEVGQSLPMTVTDPNLQVRTYTWDDFGHLVRSQSAEWGTMRWYYVQGRMTQRVDPDGRRADYSYDMMGRVIVVDNDAANPGAVGQDYRFYYDNAFGSVACPAGSPYACIYRRGQLARVQIEYAPGLFYDMLYDYAVDGQTGVEQWPDGKQTYYYYDAAGRLTRMRQPVSTTDSIAYSYDATSGNALDQTEVVAMAGELWNGTAWTNWVTWGSAMGRDSAGRLTSVTPGDAFSTAFPDQFTYRTDGRLATLRARRRSASSAVDMVNRTYTYAVDGASVGFSGTATGDVARTFRYDQGNRLVCLTSVAGSGTCPVSGSPLISSYAYNASDTRTQLVDFVSPTTTTRSYTLLGNSLATETWPGHTVTFGHPPYAPNGGRRATDDDSAYTTTLDTRTYGYDGEGRLRTVSLIRPFGSAPTTHAHTITILYDHRSRPFLVTDADTTAGTQANTQYYYDLHDRLTGRILTPSIAAPATTTIDMFEQVDTLLTGIDRLQFVGGVYSGESFYYTANAPEGTPLATYSFTRGGSTSTEVWRPAWGGFGELRSATGAMASPPPWRFAGQLELTGSDASVWVASTATQVREPLSLNRWRAYDPRVGQYLQPEPLLVLGRTTLSHPYAYAYVAPGDFVDPDGRDGGVLGGAIVICAASGVCEVIGAVLLVGVGVGLVIWWATAPRPGDTLDPDLPRGGDTAATDECSDGETPPISVPVPTTGNPTPPENPEDCRSTASYLGGAGGAAIECVYSCNGSPWRLVCQTMSCASNLAEQLAQPDCDLSTLTNGTRRLLD